MSFEITATVDCYLLPDDGVAAKALFLQHLEDPYEMWIIAYAFTLGPMIDEIIKNNTAGSPIHIYLDYSESITSTEKPEVQKLVDAGVEVTIGTSTAGEQYICHTKGIVCDDKPVPWCWEGSVNFSASGWSQVNTALFFRSQPYRDAFVNQFTHLRYFAWTQERAKQLMKTPPAGALTPPSDAPPPGLTPVPVSTSAQPVPVAAGKVKSAKKSGSKTAAKAKPKKPASATKKESSAKKRR
jgi:hypothetical protein